MACFERPHTARFAAKHIHPSDCFQSRWSASTIVLIQFWFFIVALGTLTFAQTPGIIPYSSYKFHQYDTIAHADLNRLITIPVRSKSGPIPFEANLVMNNIVHAGNAGLSLQVTRTGLTSYQTTNTNCPYQPPNPPPPTTYYHGFNFTDATGAVHSFPNIAFDSANCLDISEDTSQETTDGTGLTASATQNADGTIKYYEVLDVNGNIYNYNASNSNALVTDKNGNTLSATLSGSTRTYTDSTGQVVLTATYGAVGPPRGADTYSYLDANGNTQTVSVNYSQYTQQTAWSCLTINPTVVYFPSSVTFPDGSSMSFTYEHGMGTNAGTVTGRIASFTLPTGGTISYTYTGGSNGINSDCTPATLTRTENGQTATYVHTTIDANYHASTTETLPDGGTETFLFAGGQYVLATFLYSDVVQDSTGNITSTKLIDFNGLPNGSPRNGPLGAAPPISTTDIYSYKGGASVTAGSVHTQTTLDGQFYALPIDSKTYTPATSTTVYSDTATTYGSFGGSGCTSTTGNFVCTSLTTDGSGNTLKSFRFTYDSHWNQTSASSLTGGTNYLTSSKTYNSNGTVATSTSVFGDVTANSMTLCGNTLPTTTTNAVVTYTYTWDCNGGVMNSVNNMVGTKSFVYNDPLYRQSQSTDESGAATNYAYTQISGEATMNFGSSTEDGIVTLDSFGHKLSSQIADGTSYDTTSHTYLGDHLASDSLPCSAALNSTCPTTKFSYTYDTVGRISVKTDVTTQATRAYSYNVNDTLMTVSGGTSPVRKVQTEVDGLGRLISVCEITTLPGSASCGQTTAATGYLTTYQYNPVGQLTSITQFANGSSPQTRTFTYDNIGRKLTENTPEAGLIQFFYDTAPATPGVACTGTYNGKLVKRYDARGNTTCYKYDSLGRTSSVVYSGPGSTGVNKYFVYDAATVNGQTMSNAKEQMAEAYTATSATGTKITDLGFSYDITGRPSDVYELTPNSSGYYHTMATYNPNGTLATLGGVPGRPTWTFGLDPMGRFKTLSETSNCNGSCLNLVSSAFYNLGRPITINYGSGDSDSFTYSTSTGMESGYTLRQGSNSFKDNNLTWFPTGQLSKQVFADTITPANAQTCTYSYDDMSRLTSDNCGSAWSQTFTYDSFGNIVKSGSSSFAATYNNKNQIATLGSNVPTYDASGNLLTINTGTLHTYTWDAENRVASIDGKTLTYDALDRVVEEGSTLQILYGPTGKLGVQSGQTNTRTYLGLPKGAQVLYDGSSVVYVHPDLMGNGILGTNNAQGKVFDRMFAPFGEEYDNSGSTVANFTGNMQDLDPNLYDFKYREDSPVQGRWLNPDPSGMAAVSLGDPQTLNRYSYVRNSAMGLTDVNGLSIGVDRGLWAYSTFANNFGGDGGDDMELMTADVAAAQQLDEAQHNVWETLKGTGAIPLFGAAAAQDQVTPQSLTAQIPVDVRAGLATLIQDSNSPTSDDKQGGFHEEYGVAGLNEFGDWMISKDKSGAYANPDTDKIAQPSYQPRDPELANSMVDPRVVAHVHPGGTTGAGNSWKQPPSPADKDAAISGQINIVFGAGNKKVYFYNSSGEIGKQPMKLKDFLGQ